MSHSAPLDDLRVLRTYLREHLGAHVVSTAHTADRETVLKMLNDALETELISVLRYRTHHFMARSTHSQIVAQEFLDHANQALAHAGRLAERIVQLGGAPAFALNDIGARSHTKYVEGRSISGMIRDNMLAKHLAIDGYHSLIQYLGDSDPVTHCLLEDILTVEERQNDELAEQQVNLHMQRHITWPSLSAAACHYSDMATA